LPHVTDGETTERSILVILLNAHGLGRDEGSNASIAGLDELGGSLNGLAGTTIDLLNELLELAGNVGGVAIENRSVAGADLTRVVQDDDLGGEGGSLLGGIVLGVRGNVTTANILDRYVLDVEADVVTGVALLELLVVHLDGLDFSGHVGRSESANHAGLDDTSLDTTDGHRANATNFVDILERKTERLVGGTDGGLDSIDSIEESLALDDTSLCLLSPALEPAHVGGLLQHVVTVPAGDGDEGDSLGVVTDLLDEVGGFLDNFVVTVLAPLGGVHLVDGHDELSDTKGEGKKSVFTGLTILGDTSLEFTSTSGNDEDSTISLRGTSDHVLDEITMSGSIDDSNHELGGLKFPESDIDGDTALTFSLELIEHPGILEGALAEFSGFLLELFNGTLIDTTALVDQMSSGGGLAGIDVTDNDDVNVQLLLSHF